MDSGRGDDVCGRPEEGQSGPVAGEGCLGGFEVIGHVLVFKADTDRAPSGIANIKVCCIALHNDGEVLSACGKPCEADAEPFGHSRRNIVSGFFRQKLSLLPDLHHLLPRLVIPPNLTLSLLLSSSSPTLRKFRCQCPA